MHTIRVISSSSAIRNFANDEKPELTDDQIRRLIIESSIAAYSGRCPCPYNVMRNGRQCGGNSAYSKPGGAEPICYERDVSQRMIEEFRRKFARYN